MRRGEMLALRFGDIDWRRRMITLRGPTTKSRRTRLVPVERVDLADVALRISPETARRRVCCDPAHLARVTIDERRSWSGVMLTARRP